QGIMILFRWSLILATIREPQLPKPPQVHFLLLADLPFCVHRNF
ncbi:uncharacterized protein METZ01_LOCUS444463, partial [marine metagenome]